MINLIELELFYKIVESAMRKNHTEYLEREKREPLPIDLPKVDELPSGEAWKKLKFSARISLYLKRRKQLKARKKAEKKRLEIHVAERLLKGYNAGVKMSLKVLKNEFKRLEKRIKAAENS